MKVLQLNFIFKKVIGIWLVTIHQYFSYVSYEIQLNSLISFIAKERPKNSSKESNCCLGLLGACSWEHPPGYDFDEWPQLNGIYMYKLFHKRKVIVINWIKIQKTNLHKLNKLLFLQAISFLECNHQWTRYYKVDFSLILTLIDIVLVQIMNIFLLIAHIDLK